MRIGAGSSTANAAMPPRAERKKTASVVEGYRPPGDGGYRKGAALKSRLNCESELVRIRSENSMFRKVISWGLVLLTPGWLIAQEASTALVYGTGSVYLDGSQLTNSSAVTNGDVIQTKENGAANLSAPGSSVVIESNTIARFQSGGLALDRGSVSVATGKGMTVFARDFKVTPATGAWTEFYVTRASGAIQILARKNGLTVSCGSNTSTIKEGQQISRDDAADCGIAQKGGGGATTAAKGPILTSPAVGYAGLGAGAGLLIWALAQGDDPVSPSVP